MKKLFHKEGCERCYELIMKLEFQEKLNDYERIDVGTAEGLAELAFYELKRVAETEGLPIIYDAEKRQIEPLKAKECIDDECKI